MSVPCPPRRGHPPADLIRQREMKWVEMTSHWDKTMSRRYKKVRGVAAPPRPPWLILLCLCPGPGKICPSSVPLPPAFSPYHPPKWPLPDDKSCLAPANRSRGGWPSWPNGTPWPHPQVKMQCRKGIPSALRARCWPLLCGAHVCQKNSPGTYQVKELARVPPPLPRVPGHSEPLRPPSCLRTGTG